LNQNTCIYCIQKNLKITCSIKISNTIMWYLNQYPLFIINIIPNTELRPYSRFIINYSKIYLLKTQFNSL
jgi:hypothetical protein